MVRHFKQKLTSNLDGQLVVDLVLISAVVLQKRILWIKFNRCYSLFFLHSPHRRNNHGDRGRLVPNFWVAWDQPCIDPSRV